MIDTLIDELAPLVKAETDRAMEHHGKIYHSPHEAYAVLREEIEELAEELEYIVKELCMDDEKRDGSLWDMTRGFAEDAPAIRSMLACAYKDTFNAAMRASGEALQVAAVAVKALQSMDSWK